MAESSQAARNGTTATSRAEEWGGVLLVCVVVASGCAARAPLHYDLPTNPPAAGPGAPILELEPIGDARTDSDIDSALAEAPTASLQDITRRELESVGLFSEVREVGPAGDRAPEPAGVADSAMAAPGTVRLQLALSRLEWEVPYYGAKVTGGAIASLAGSFVGFFIYAAIPTDVNGYAALEATLTDAGTGETLLQRTYEGAFTERESMGACDVPVEKSLVTGNALEATMSDLKADLAEVVPAYVARRRSDGARLLADR